MIEVLYKNGSFYTINHEENESREIFLERSWFIVNNYESGDVKQLNGLSHAWVNMKFFGMRYSQKIESQIKSMRYH